MLKKIYEKIKGGGKLVWIFICLGIVLLCYACFVFGGGFPSKDILKLVEKKYENAIKIRDDLIQEKDNALQESEAKYQLLVQRIKAKAKQKEKILTPKTDDEMKKRFTDAGFPPISDK